LTESESSNAFGGGGRTAGERQVGKGKWEIRYPPISPERAPVQMEGIEAGQLL